MFARIKVKKGLVKGLVKGLANAFLTAHYGVKLRLSFIC